MNARMAGQFVGSAEALATSRELAGMRLLASMSADMPGLMFEAVEGSVAQGALVGSREILSLFGIVCSADSGRHQADGGSYVGVRWS